MSKKETYFYIDVFPAGYGDCFMVRCCDGKDKTNILIDGGLYDTYHDYLKHYLGIMKKNKEIIDLLVVTHIDCDHIEGIIEFLKENNDSKKPMKVKEIWHNGLIHLIPKTKRKKNNKIPPNELEKFLKEIKKGFLKSNTKKKRKVAGKEGIALSSLIEGRYQWNETFQKKAVAVPLVGNQKNFINGQIQIELISPDVGALQNLKEYFLNYFKIKKIFDEKVIDEAFEFIASREEELGKVITKSKTSLTRSFNISKLLQTIEKNDTSKTNGSSIAFSLDFMNMKLLFLGDSHSNALHKLSNRKFNFVKVSHHGSQKNTPKDFNNILEADKYLFSTNGVRHKHPDFECLARIISNKKEKELIFNYDLPKYKFLSNGKNDKYKVIANKQNKIFRIDLNSNKYFYISFKEKNGKYDSLSITKY